MLRLPQLAQVWHSLNFLGVGNKEIIFDTRTIFLHMVFVVRFVKFVASVLIMKIP